MTHETIRLSPTKVARQSFADELRRAMAARKVDDSALAQRMGIHRAAVWQWRTGAKMPMLAMADRLAEALDWDSLLTMVMIHRRKRCARCRKTYYRGSRPNQKYCGSTCKRAVDKAKASDRLISRSRSRVKWLQDAIALHCKGCEPLGICRDSTCALRPVSPLPLIQRMA